jgi:hypothetical protein
MYLDDLMLSVVTHFLARRMETAYEAKLLEQL